MQKKVECPSCGGTGVILRRLRPYHNSEAEPCHKCGGFGVILMDPAEFAKCKSDSRRYGRSTRFMAFGECKEFTGLVKVRNIDIVSFPKRGPYVPESVPYGVFYKEHRNHR